MRNKESIFSATAFFVSRPPAKWFYVRDTDKLISWLQTKYPGQWKYVNIYERKTGRFICRSYSPQFPARLNL